MKMYFALSSAQPDNLVLFNTEAKHFLFSYHYYKTDNQKEKVLKWDKSNTYFIDSGAFSAMSLGKAINIDQYCNFIKEMQIPLYANLDVIGNSESSLKNYEYMVNKGLKPLPVFHWKENIIYLDKILDSDIDYFCLGGMVTANNLDEWLLPVWQHIYRKRPDIKVHGFGLTDVAFILKYPWHSIDSSSWASPTRFARFSVWNPARHIFQQKSVSEIFRREGIEYLPGDPITGDKRWRIIDLQVKEYLKAEEYLNSKIYSFDYSYLEKQLNIFDL